MLALGCYTALERLGWRCPDDVSVVGFNDMPFMDRVSPPLTTVGIPHYEVGTQAAELLLERIVGDQVPVKIVLLAPELVVRGSTAPVPIGPKLTRRRPTSPGLRVLSGPGLSAK
jgi:LacI family transcriptional regulator